MDVPIRIHTGDVGQAGAVRPDLFRLVVQKLGRNDLSALLVLMLEEKLEILTPVPPRVPLDVRAFELQGVTRHRIRGDGHEVIPAELVENQEGHNKQDKGKSLRHSFLTAHVWSPLHIGKLYRQDTTSIRLNQPFLVLATLVLCHYTASTMIDTFAIFGFTMALVLVADVTDMVGVGRNALTAIWKTVEELRDPHLSDEEKGAVARDGASVMLVYFFQLAWRGALVLIVPFSLLFALDLLNLVEFSEILAFLTSWHYILSMSIGWLVISRAMKWVRSQIRRDGCS